MNSRFMGKIIDWKTFELFVKNLYDNESEVIAEHNVTVEGKSGAKRQIDVLIKQKTKLHEYITLVECKSWKQKVSRNIIDIMYASIDDLNASKGVIFTTSGYEAGAIEYAKTKNIDIFLVREMMKEEWGLPGRNIHFYMHIISSELKNISMQNSKLIPIVQKYPNEIALPEIEVKKEMQLNKELNLYSIVDGDSKNNFVNILLKYQDEIVREVSDGIDSSQMGNKESDLIVKIPIKLDFLNTEFRQLRLKFGAVELSEVIADLNIYVSQSLFQFDRAEGLDYALIVENYINRHKWIAAKKSDEDHTTLSERIYDNLIEEKILRDNEVLENGSIMKIYTEPYVSYKVKGTELIGKADMISKRVVV